MTRAKLTQVRVGCIMALGRLPNATVLGCTYVGCVIDLVYIDIDKSLVVYRIVHPPVMLQTWSRESGVRLPARETVFGELSQFVFCLNKLSH